MKKFVAALTLVVALSASTSAHAYWWPTYSFRPVISNFWGKLGALNAYADEMAAALGGW